MKPNAINKRARYDYTLIKEFEAGLILNGHEIKSIRANEVSINEAFIIFKKSEPYIINMHINQYKFSSKNITNIDPTRHRKILLNKKEIRFLEQEVKLQKVIIIPTKLYIRNNVAKIQIYTAKAKRKQDKRQLIKERDIKREIAKKYR